MNIGLIGGYRETQFRAPYFDHDWTIWATAVKNMEWTPAFDAWFEIHSPELFELHPDTFTQKYVDWLATLPLVYVHPKQDMQPGFVPYPVDEMVAEFGRSPFTSTAAWMFAKAITEKPETIGLWGFEMSGSDEYGYQRRGLHELIRGAEDRGIKVVVPAGSTLLDPLPLYGQGVI